MTEKDEKAFSELLKAQIPSIRFIDIYPWPTPDPPIRDSLDECRARLNSGAVIINTEILSLEHYRSGYIGCIPEHNQHHGSTVGSGLIQFEHGEPANYEPDGLRNGSLAASYDNEKDPATDTFVKTVWKLCRKHAKKLYGIDPATRRYITDKPVSPFIAWPDAIARYDQVDGLFLTNNTMCYLTSKR